MTTSRIFTARHVIASSNSDFEGGGVAVEAGLISEILESRAAVERAAAETGAELIDLGELVLTPGLVNAHAHLELSDMRGRLSGEGDFPGWIRSLLGLRAELAESEEGQRERAFENGALELARSGCTLVADIDSSGLASGALGANRLRIVAYREALDIGDASRRAAVLASLSRDSELKAISPHAPYSASVELARALGELAREQNLAVGVHWSETEEEGEWLLEGRGSFAPLLGAGLPSPRRSGLELLHDAGLLNERTTLYHGNHPRPAEFGVVRDAGASLVHCPGAHLFFDRSEFPLERWLEAGVNVALGTDSLASNESLDMLRELRLLRENFPALSPELCFRMATENGARAMGLASQAGRLGAGAWADFAAFEVSAVGSKEVLEELTSGRAKARGTWVAGEAVNSRDEA